MIRRYPVRTVYQICDGVVRRGRIQVRDRAIDGRQTVRQHKNRFELDVGKTILEKAPSATAALARLREVRDYVREVVAASFKKLSETARPISTGRVAGLVRDALVDTFEVFAGYSE